MHRPLKQVVDRYTETSSLGYLDLIRWFGIFTAFYIRRRAFSAFDFGIRTVHAYTRIRGVIFYTQLTVNVHTYPKLIKLAVSW
jgi:hypothetical protein